MGTTVVIASNKSRAIINFVAIFWLFIFGIFDIK